MPFEKSVKINDWAMNHGVEAEDSANDYQGQTWQFRVAILPTKTNLESALNALNGLSVFNGPNHPTAKIIQIETNDLTQWDGTLADAADRDQRGKELCVYLPYNSVTNKFLFDQAYIKNLMLDIWKALQDAGVEISYITPNQGEEEIKSDPTVLTPFCYSSFKPYSAPEGTLYSDNYNPNGHPDPLDGLHFSVADLRGKGITNFDAQTVSKSRIHYMQDHYQITIQQLNKTIEELTSRAKPSSYASSKDRINQALASKNEKLINDLLTDLQHNYVSFYTCFPTKFNKGSRFPILEEGHINYLINKAEFKEKKEVLIKLQEKTDEIIQQLLVDLMAENWPIDKPDEAVIRELVNTFPFELQAAVPVTYSTVRQYCIPTILFRKLFCYFIFNLKLNDRMSKDVTNKKIFVCSWVDHCSS
ncbi:hypothetical protein TUM19329_19640 [Legionella antarctica]|uniref:Uncharacterized protein n=1 Tax=Legionella antarctica TaxID=2708020 RepID=A0A6F8T5W7_9GAMM|nr:hypothetical protein [Legionella antarctica]BCA95603.1 hypothetical protein TUM19329_19640 [Legionella antarctica]